ncbi:OapC/ArvC family zinc-ribbon domain-containing protein [Halobellus sp. GM3]|uniref:OapC/ArvC family zinc-ribbon domain-containing protein n=1 Tax=Halobellus sp. GM3 TaxID=3458410 RepID=UPI00403D5DD5
MPHECTNCGRVFADGSKEMLSGCPNCGGNKFQFRPSSATPSESTEPANASGTDSPSTEPQTTDPSSSTAWSGSADRALDDRPDTPTETPTSSDPSQADRRGEPPSPEGPEGTDSSRQWVSQRREDASSRGRSDEREQSDDRKPSDEPARTGAADTREGGTAPREGGTDSGDRDTGSDRAGASTSVDDQAIEDTAQASARSDVVSPDELAAASASQPDSDAPEPEQSPRNAGDRPATDSEGRVIEPSSEERPGLDELREELNEQFESIRIVAPGEYELNLMELYDRTEYIISLQEDGRYVIEVPDTWDTTPDEPERS